MTKRLLACALISTTSWLVACGSDSVDSTGQPQDGGAGAKTTGSSGAGGGGQAGSSVTTAAGGSGGSAVGGSGGVAGGGGAAGTPVVDAGPPVSLCDGKTKKALPYNIISDYRAVAVIGTEATFSIAANPDCVTPYPTPEAGTDAASTDGASADGADETTTLALDLSDATDATTADVSASDASALDAGTSDAAKSDAAVVDAGPPPPACYELHYNPDLCEAATCWAGVIFQPGATSVAADAAAQTSAGICIEPGATKVEFMARANRNMARIKFGAIRAGMGITEFFLNVTTQWALYTIAIPANDPYNESATTTGGVWNGFSAVVEPADHAGGTIISIKDIVWKK